MEIYSLNNTRSPGTWHLERSEPVPRAYFIVADYATGNTPAKMDYRLHATISGLSSGAKIVPLMGLMMSFQWHY